MPDSFYDQTLSAAARARDQQLAGLGDQQNRLRLSYGYTPAGQLDPSNPYGQAQLLRDAYQRQKTGTTNSMASRGQLYSGALNREQGFQLGRYNQSSNQLRQAYDAQSGQIAGQAIGINNDYQQAALAALGAFQDRQLQSAEQQAYLASLGTGADPAAAGPAAQQQPQNMLAQLIAQHGGQNVKLTDKGLFYKRQSDGKWIPVKG